MTNCTLSRAERYYQLLGEKNSEEISKLLHPQATFRSALASLKGKEAVMEAISNFMHMLSELNVRTIMEKGDQAIAVYEITVPGCVEDFPAAALLTFDDGLIRSLELFYDTLPFVQKKEEIFSSAAS